MSKCLYCGAENVDHRHFVDCEGLKKINEVDVNQRVLEIVAEMMGNSDVYPKAALIDDLHFSAIRLFDLMAILEGKFEIKISDEIVGTWISVQDVVNTVLKAVHE